MLSLDLLGALNSPWKTQADSLHNVPRAKNAIFLKISGFIQRFPRVLLLEHRRIKGLLQIELFQDTMKHRVQDPHVGFPIWLPELVAFQAV